MKNLVIVRAGDRSFHPNWVAGPEAPQFDLAVSYFGDEVGRYREHSDLMYEGRKGGKWEVVADMLHRWATTVDAYDAVMFADDDLDADTETWNRFFEVFHQHNLDMAQPALTPASPSFWSEVRRQRHKKLRFTNFVEVMCPCFSRRALEVVSPTFLESRTGTGWGLDILWPYLVYWPEYRTAIVDCCPVTHTRPSGKGEIVSHYTSIALDPGTEYMNIIRKYSLPPELKDVRQFKIIERGFILNKGHRDPTAAGSRRAEGADLRSVP